jgi:hypothetical protein
VRSPRITKALRVAKEEMGPGREKRHRAVEKGDQQWRNGLSPNDRPGGERIRRGALRCAAGLNVSA